MMETKSAFAHHYNLSNWHLGAPWYLLKVGMSALDYIMGDLIAF